MKKDNKYNYNLATDRNIGILSKGEQRLLSQQHIAIAGCGAEGGALAVNLARLGVKKFKLADPKYYDIYDLNRQYCHTNDIGKKKCQIIRHEILAIDPQAEVEIYPNGISQDNLEKFLNKSTLVIDALDFENPEISIMLHKECIKRDLFVFSGVSVGYGCNVFAFNPKSRLTMEKFLNLSAFSWVPKLPVYLDKKMFKDVISGKRSAPVVVMGVMAMASVLIFEILKHISNKKIALVPNYLNIDLASGKFEKRNILQDTGRV